MDTDLIMHAPSCIHNCDLHDWIDDDQIILTNNLGDDIVNCNHDLFTDQAGAGEINSL